MSPVMLPEFRLSYREAARLLGVDRATISDLAKRRNLERDGGKPLDVVGFREIAGILNVPIEDSRLTA